MERPTLRYKVGVQDGRMARASDELIAALGWIDHAASKASTEEELFDLDMAYKNVQAALRRIDPHTDY